MELTTAAASVAVVVRFDVGWTILPPLVAAASLVTLSAVDLRAYRLPDAISFPASGLSLVAIAAASVAIGRPGAIVSALVTALGIGGVLWVAHGFRPSGLGFGDVKLGPLLGLHLGWVAGTFHTGWTAVLGLAAQALLLSSLIGLAMGLVVGLLRRWGIDALPGPRRGLPAGGTGAPLSHPGRRPPARSRMRLRDTNFPFGPALAAGTLAAVLFSEALPV